MPKKFKSVMVQIEPELEDKLLVMRKELKCSRSQLLRWLITLGMQIWEQKNPLASLKTD